MLLASAAGTHAQNYVANPLEALTWGTFNEDPKRNTIEVMLADHQGELWALRTRITRFMGPDMMYIEKYNQPDFSVALSRPFNLPIDNNRVHEFQALFPFGNQLVLCTSHRDPKRKVAGAYLHTISPDGLLKESERPSVEARAAPGRGLGEFRFASAPTGSNVLIGYRPNLEKGLNQTVSLYAFNAFGQQLWNREMELPYKAESVSFGHQLIDDAGNAYLLARITDLDRKWVKGEPNFRFIVLALFNNGTDVREFEVSLPERSISSIALEHGNDGAVIAGGLCSEAAAYLSEMSGMFFLEIDPATQQISAAGIHDLSDQAMGRFMPAKQVAKQKELTDFGLAQILVTDSGNMVFIAEQEYIRQRCTTDPRTGIVNCIDHYHYGDLLAVHLSREGKASWEVRIPKMQHSTDDSGPYASFASALKGEGLSVWFLDHHKNIKGDQEAAPKTMINPASAELFCYSITAEGTTKKTLLKSSESGTVIAVPKISLLNEGKGVVVYGREKRGFRYALLTPQP